MLSKLKPWLYLAPALFFLVMFTYYPMLQVLWDSFFFKEFGATSAHFAGLDNYRRLFADPDFAQAVKNNIIYALGTIIPSLAIGLGLALALMESSRFNNFVRSLFFFPTLVPLIAAAALWIFVYFPHIGLLDYYLAKLGIGSTDWLGDSDNALYSLMVLSIWKNSGFYMLFYIAGLQGIGKEYYEAAELEGATYFQRLRYITLPLLGPTTAFVFIIALIHVFTYVDHVVMMTRGGPMGSTNLVLFYIFENAHEFSDPAKATTSTVVSVAVLLAFSYFSIRTMEKGIHYES
jgi:sn-glycerol 3-phosphate transport system permease protein